MTWLLIIIGCGAGIANFTLTRRLWAAQDTPRLATGHVVIGRVEVSGAAQLAHGVTLVTSPLSGHQYVWWDAVVEEEVGSGKSKKWEARFRVSTKPWIHIADGTGPVLANVPPSVRTSENIYMSFLDSLPARMGYLQLARAVEGVSGSKLYSRATSQEFERLGSTQLQWPGIEDEGSSNHRIPVAEFPGRWKITERFIKRDEEMYVLGSTTYDNNSHGARFEHSAKRPMIMRRGDEAAFTVGLEWQVKLYAGLAIIGLFLGPALVFGGNEPGDRTPNWLAGLIAVGVFGALWFLGRIVRVRNRITATKQQVAAGAGLVEIALRKRADLIPNLVAVAEATSGNQHPHAGAAANHLHVQEQLAHVETDLAVAQGFVADAEAIHQTRISTFPDSLVARLFRLDRVANAVSPKV
jgi:hypothetical protein